MKTRLLIIAAIALFTIGLVGGMIIFNDYISNDQNKIKPTLIGEKQAYEVVTKVGHWTKAKLDGKTMNMELLHIKNDGFAFFVDKETLEDGELFMNKFQQIQEGQYVWQVKIMSKNNVVTDYLLDASNGTVLSRSDFRFSKINLEVFGSYSPLTLKDHFLQGYLEPANPMDSHNISIFVDDVFMGTTSTDPDGCFQFNSWDDSKLEQKFKEIIESDKKKIEHSPAEIKFTAVYLENENHNPVNMTKNSYLYLGLVPLAWPSYDVSIFPSVIHLTKGSPVNFELTVKPNQKEVEIKHMEINMKRLPCGVTWASTTSSAEPDSDKVTMDHAGTFHLILSATDYAKSGKYFVEIQHNSDNPYVIDSNIAGFELVISEK